MFENEDITQVIFDHVDHFELMRTCCCKEWLTAVQRILNAVIRTDVMNFGYMTACRNLVSITINDIDTLEHREYTFPNIKTIVCAGENCHYKLLRMRKIFNNAKNIVLDCKRCSGGLPPILCVSVYQEYMRTETFTIMNTDVQIYATPVIPVTFINCKIQTNGPFENFTNLTLQ
jgi:hypothetical protein